VYWRKAAASSNGQDVVFSRLRWEFDSPRCYQEDRCVCKRVKWRCDAGSFNGRTRVFEARHERSIRSPAARFKLKRSSRSGEGYGYFFGQKTPYLIVPSSRCEVIQLVRTTGSDPVHAGSNPALAAKFEDGSQGLAAKTPDCLSGETGSIPVATANVLNERAWYSGWCLGPPTR
jgi:hypothetical protein